MTNLMTAPLTQEIATLMEDIKEHASQRLLAVAHAAELNGEEIDAIELVRRTVTALRAEATKRRGYKGAKAQQDASDCDALADAIERRLVEATSEPEGTKVSITGGEFAGKTGIITGRRGRLGGTRRGKAPLYPVFIPDVGGVRIPQDDLFIVSGDTDPAMLNRYRAAYEAQ